MVCIVSELWNLNHSQRQLQPVTRLKWMIHPSPQAHRIRIARRIYYPLKTSLARSPFHVPSDAQRNTGLTACSAPTPAPLSRDMPLIHTRLKKGEDKLCVVVFLLQMNQQESVEALSIHLQFLRNSPMTLPMRYWLLDYVVDSGP